MYNKILKITIIDFIFEIMNGNIKSWINLYYKRFDTQKIIELPVLSGSMIPQLIPGKNVGIRSYNNEKLNRGDIIVFKQEKKLFAHRIIIILSIFRKKFIYQKGDNNLFGSWIRHSDIIGIINYSIVQDDKKLDFTNNEIQKLAKKIASKQLIKNIINIFLFIPRKVKNFIKKLLRNFLHF